MVAAGTTPDIADKKPPAATPALQPAALIRLSRADNEQTAAAAAVRRSDARSCDNASQRT